MVPKTVRPCATSRATNGPVGAGWAGGGGRLGAVGGRRGGGLGEDEGEGEQLHGDEPPDDDSSSPSVARRTSGVLECP